MFVGGSFAEAVLFQVLHRLFFSGFPWLPAAKSGRTGFRWRQCIGVLACGLVFVFVPPLALNSLQDSPEEGEKEEETPCSGTDLRGQSCRSLGFTAGSLRCRPDGEFDTSGCTKCGNGVVEEGEECDGLATLPGCRELGFPDGTTNCNADCTIQTEKCRKWDGLTAGSRHACARHPDGGVWCWGDNSNGQLGVQTTAESNVPVAVARLGTSIAGLSAGAEHTCAVRTNGTVWCWGLNTVDGRLGDGTTVPRRTPVMVTGLDTRVRSVQAGGSHTCVVNVDDAVLCWGGNSHGQLGDGTVNERHRPVAVSGLSGGVDLVSVGETHSCVLKKDASVWCWGDNSHGQIGADAPSRAVTPVRIAGFIGGVSLHAGHRHTCAVLKTGNVRCTGSGPPEAGVGRIEASLDRDLFSGGPFISVASGEQHSCGLQRDGSVWCLGGNASGQLGDGTDNPANSPVRVMLPSHAPAERLEVGTAFGCIQSRRGAIWCWGDNSHGQIGNRMPQLQLSWVPVRPPADRPSSIRAGSAHTCSTASTGKTWCWGDNSRGQLGDGTTTASPAGRAVAGLPESMTHVSTGRAHSCALGSDESVWCWGDNSHGQIGNPGQAVFRTALQVAGPDPGVRQVACGADHLCLLYRNGTVACRGKNTSGQIGAKPGSATSGFHTPRNQDRDLVSVVAGSDHSCVIRQDGRVLCWGDNTHGQLGDGTTVQTASPVETSLRDRKAASMVAGSRHTCAISPEGQAWCWGFNFYGQLGDGTTEDRAFPVQVAALSDTVHAMAAGESHTCAIRRDRSVWCWGKNDRGQLGDGTTSMRRTPTQVPVLKASAITAGGQHSCIIRDNGAGFCWGSATAGQLGDGTIGRLNRPQAVRLFQ